MIAILYKEEGDYYLGWLAFVCSILGYYFLIKKSHWVFPIWTVSNIGWVVLAVYNKDLPQLALFSIYIVINFYGWYKWAQGSTIIIGAVYQNSKNGVFYRVLGIDGEQVVYMCEDTQLYSRPVKEWFGKNRKGEVRFKHAPIHNDKVPKVCSWN